MISSGMAKKIRALSSICAQAKSIRGWLNKMQADKVSDEDRCEMIDYLGDLNSDLNLCIEDASKLWRAFEVIEVANDPQSMTSQIEE